MSSESIEADSAQINGRYLALCVAGPAALGLVLAVRDGTALTEVGRLPLLWLGVAALMVPALYIGAALSGLSPSARDVVRAAVDGLSRGGGLLLGLAPGLLFLVVTSQEGAVARGLVGLCAVLGALSGLAVIFRRLFVAHDASILARFVFFGWSAVLLGIGTQLFTIGQV